ncbi:hypothetical protein LQW54_013148 [Pestalotiopsis sp. IQ-011]
MDGQNIPTAGASFAIKRRPVSVSHRKPVPQSPSSPSQIPSPQLSARISDFSDIEAYQDNFPQSTGSASPGIKNAIENNNSPHGLPTPPPSASPGLSQPSPSSPPPQGAHSFFQPFETASPPTPPLSARPEQIRFTSPPPSTRAPAPEPRPAVPPRPTSTANASSQPGPAPTGHRPAFSQQPSAAASPGATDGASPHPEYRSNTRRLRDAANRHLNRDTARRAYDRLGRIINASMPVLSVTNPELAAMYRQINQAGAHGGVLPFVGALAQAAISDDSNTVDAMGMPFLDMFSQQAAGFGSPSDGGFDPSTYLAAALAQQNDGSGVGADVMASYIQEQTNAATANFQANMANMQSVSNPFLDIMADTQGSGNPYVDIMAAAQSGDSVQFMNAFMNYQQQQQAATMASFTSGNTMPTDFAFPGGQPDAAPTAQEEASFSAEFTTGGQDPDFTVPEQQNGPAPSYETSEEPTPQFTASSGAQDIPQQNPWIRQSIPRFGLSSISLPPSSGVLQPLGHNMLDGALPDLSGSFEMQLLYSSRQVFDEMSSMQQLRSDGEVTVLEPCAMHSFGIPCGGVSVACAVVGNAPEDGEEGGKVPAVYRVVVQSPHGHGLALAYYVPAEHLHGAKTVATTMVSSIVWMDRATICDSVAGKLLGEWRWGEEAPLIDLGGGFERESKRLTFTADGRYEYRGSGGVATDSAQRTEDLGRKGRFEVFEYKDGPVHLVLSDDRTSKVEVQEIALSEDIMAVNGKTYRKIGAL